jgi:cytochrome c-type biogenesis protein CcmH
MPVVAIFWTIALLLVAATVGALAWPLLRARPVPPEPDDAAATNVYRDHKRQLDDELREGSIAQAEYDASLRELASRLGAEMTPPVATAAPSRLPFTAALTLVALLPVSALLLYVTLGNPNALQSAPTTSARAPMSHEDLTTIVDKLAARMKEQPEDPTGWKLLARAYSAMGRFDDAVAAFREASARSSQQDPALLADWADALAMKQQTLQGEPTQLIARALAIDPRNQKALALSASAALERKDYDAAIAEWEKLQAQFAPASAEAKEIATMLAEATAAKRGEPAVTSSASSGPTAAKASAAAPTATQANAADATVRVHVSLDPKLRDRVASDDALFVYARAVGGSRMPLAVIRTKAGALPQTFTLDDSMAMSPAARLSSAADVIVEARVSKTGNATPRTGDLRGISKEVKPGADEVSVVIDGVLP